MLFKQTEVCSYQIEQTVQKFESDLNYILFSDEIASIFSEGEKSDGLRKLELFYSSYNNLIKNIDIYDNNKNVLNIFRDRKKNFITDSYLAQRQRPLSNKEEVIMEGSECQYVLPVFLKDDINANILVTLNLNNYILSELKKFHLEGITWQWLINMENKELYNSDGKIAPKFEGLDGIEKNLEEEHSGMFIHEIRTDSTDNKLITVYTPIKVLNKKFGIAISIDYSIFLNQIFSELAIIVITSFVIFLLVSLFLFFQIQTLKKKIQP